MYYFKYETNLKLILFIELLAFYSVAPSIILTILDQERGILGKEISIFYRMFFYALFIGSYSFIQMCVASFIGKQVDKCSKKEILKRIHLANSLGYALFAVSIVIKQVWLSLLGLMIPALVGGVLPIVKTLIAECTPESERTQEFSKLVRIKGMTTLLGSLVSFFILYIFPFSSYVTPFILASFLSLFAAGVTVFFIFPKQTNSQGFINPSSPFITIPRKDFKLFTLFVMIFFSYYLFVKFVPILLTERFDDMFWVSYFFAILGISTVINQTVFIHFIRLNEKILGLILCALCGMTVWLCLNSSMFLSVLLLLTTLFCFSLITVYIESSLSLTAYVGYQGKVQGILCSLENCSYLLAAIVGASLSSVNSTYAIGLVAINLLMAFGLLYRSQSEEWRTRQKEALEASIETSN